MSDDSFDHKHMKVVGTFIIMPKYLKKDAEMNGLVHFRTKAVC